MALTVKINAVAFNESTIQVKVYDAYTSPTVRADYGFAWFVLDSLGNTEVCDLEDSDDAYIMVSAAGTYDIEFYAIAQWVGDAYSYLINHIIFNEGSFYSSKQTHPGDTADSEPGVGASWTSYWNLLECASRAKFNDYYAVGTTRAGIQSSGVSVTLRSAGQDYSVTMATCYNYTVTNLNTTEYDGLRIRIYNFATGTLITTILTDDVATSVNLEALGYTEGIYIFDITGFSGTVASYSLSKDQEQYVVYELCSFHACAKTLINSILCREINTCCEPCDTATLKLQETRRVELNKLLGLYMTMMAYINMEQVEYFGIFAMDKDREVYISRINDVLTMLSTITVRCGVCTETSVKSTSGTGCSNC